MSFKRSNKMTVSEQKTMDELFSIMSKSDDEELRHEANMYKLRQTFGRDSQESEQSQFNGSNSEAAISNSQAAYDKERLVWRTRGTNADDFDKNRAAVLRESGNRDALVQKNARKSAGFDALSKATYR
jgi:hypothetical protein